MREVIGDILTPASGGASVVVCHQVNCMGLWAPASPDKSGTGSQRFSKPTENNASYGSIIQAEILGMSCTALLETKRVMWSPISLGSFLMSLEGGRRIMTRFVTDCETSQPRFPAARFVSHMGWAAGLEAATGISCWVSLWKYWYPRKLTLRYGNSFRRNGGDEMITAKQIRHGIDKGAVRFIIDPNMGKGTVCAVGATGFTSAEKQRKKNRRRSIWSTSPSKILSAILWNVLNDFRLQPETFGDKYAYYESILKESKENMQTDFERGYQKAMEEINTPMNVIMLKWSPSKCPRCQKDFSDYEPCNDGYYNRANSMERCPFCGQKLDWKRD